MNVETGGKGDDSPKDNAIYEHIADYIIQTLIKEDVNAFVEATLLHELLVYKLPPVVHKLMFLTVSEASESLKNGQEINLIKEIGGITTQKRLHFRSQHQYGAFIALYFKIIEEYPEFLEPVDDEEMFERFMIHCIHEFRQRLENFAIEVAGEKAQLDYKNKLYIHRRGTNPEDIPTYADYIAERIDSLMG
ncbi:MAG TPA: hypothetical protein VMC61_03950 [Methanocella sp.]|nr:hypothetical protein [Methanocella sp.]